MYSQPVQMQQNIPLAPFTTLRIGGPARYLARIEDEAHLIEAVAFARRETLPVFVLGGGSNLVVEDKGFDGVVLQMAIRGGTIIEHYGAHAIHSVSAGMDWDAFVLEVSRQGLSGIECLAGIPGLVGATPVQNVGAYGQEVAETIAAVRALDLETMRFVTLSNAECRFGYRKSVFNSTARGRYIVTNVSFRFDAARPVRIVYAELERHFAGREATPLEVYSAVREIRHRKGMLLVEGDSDCRSAGSFFKNPVIDAEAFNALSHRLGILPVAIPHWPVGEGSVKLAAAWLVEQAGFHKGFALGRAGISSRHTLALINRGGATSAEIAALSREVRRRVQERFRIDLEPEPVFLI